MNRFLPLAVLLALLLAPAASAQQLINCRTAPMVPIEIESFKTSNPEKVVLANTSNQDLVIISGCSLVVFDVYTEKVTYVAVSPPGTTLIPRDTYVFNMANQLPRGPGAIAFVQGTANVGEPVQNFFGREVASVVYFRQDRIFGSFKNGPSSPANTSGNASLVIADEPSFLEMIRQVAIESSDLMLVLQNPISDQLKLRLADDTDIAIYDLLGRRLLPSVTMTAGDHNLSVAGFPPGIYLVRASAQDETLTQRFTIAR